MYESVNIQAISYWIERTPGATDSAVLKQLDQLGNKLFTFQNEILPGYPNALPRKDIVQSVHHLVFIIWWVTGMVQPDGVHPSPGRTCGRWVHRGTLLPIWPLSSHYEDIRPVMPCWRQLFHHNWETRGGRERLIPSRTGPKDLSTVQSSAQVDQIEWFTSYSSSHKFYPATQTFPKPPSHSALFLCACVCTRARTHCRKQKKKRERERERERGKKKKPPFFDLLKHKSSTVTLQKKIYIRECLGLMAAVW